MRLPFFPAAIALVIGGALCGCAQRFALTPGELERVQTEAGVQPLRVYTSKKLLNFYPYSSVSKSFKVEREIQEQALGQVERFVVTKDTSGLILKIGELNGAVALWVTFEPECQKPECAYLFVQTDDKRYRLHQVPPREGFGEPINYRGGKRKACAEARNASKKSCKRRKLRPGKLASLAEANDVLLWKRNNGKILTVELQVKKIVDRRTKVRTKRAKGIR
jgi:hypothetical protein